MSKRYSDALDNLLDRPIAFNPSFKKITGSTNAALLLSQAFYWTKRTTDLNGWFYKTREDWMEETGLTESELDGAREKCRAAGVIEEKLKGVPATVHYRVVKPKVYKLLGFQFPENTETEIPQKSESGFRGKKQIQGKPDSGTYGDFNKESETTPEITPERDAPAFDFENMTISEARKHPSIKLYIDATGYMPGSILWETVHNTITENNLTTEKIHAAAVAWQGKGYKPANVTGILEWAVSGIPGKNGQRQEAPPAPRDPFASLKEFLDQKEAKA